jgi:hypothetical protein
MIADSLDVAIYRGRNLYIAMVEASKYLFVIAAIYLVITQLLLASNTPGHRKAALIGALIAMVAVALVWVHSLRTKVTIIRSNNEIVINNVWKSYRFDGNTISRMDAGQLAIVPVIGPNIRVVQISYSEPGSSVKQVPILASFSAGKKTEFLDDLESFCQQLNIPHDLSKMIY